MLKEYLEYYEKQKKCGEGVRLLSIVLLNYMETGWIIEYKKLCKKSMDKIMINFSDEWKKRIINAFNNEEARYSFLFNTFKYNLDDKYLEMFKKYTLLDYYEVINIIQNGQYNDDLLDKNIKTIICDNLFKYRYLNERDNYYKEKLNEEPKEEPKEPKLIKLKSEILEKIKTKETEYIEWEKFYNDKIKSVSNKIYRKSMEKILLYLNQDIKKCNLMILYNKDTIDLIDKFLQDYKDSTKYGYYKIINIYLLKYIKLTDTNIDYGVFNNYIKKQLSYEGSLMDVKNVIEFKDLQEKMLYIFNNKKINNDFRMILYIYMYGYNSETDMLIGILRYSDLINTLIKYDDEEIKNKNYIDIKLKKWFFKKKATKNGKEREFDIDEKFIENILKIHDKSSNKLLTLKKTTTRNIYNWNKKYDLPTLNEMRKSCVIYINSGVILKNKGEIITYQMGHTNKTENIYYNISERLEKMNPTDKIGYKDVSELNDIYENEEYDSEDETEL